MKTKTITLKYNPPLNAMTPADYTVERITDSTDFYPGETLAKHTVDGLCRVQAWKVTILPQKAVV